MIFIFEFPIHRYTGMFITFLASANNLGNSSAIHTKILALSNWWIMSWVGLGIQVLIVLWIYFWLYDWKNEGVIDVDEAMEESESDGIEHGEEMSQQYDEKKIG